MFLFALNDKRNLLVLHAISAYFAAFKVLDTFPFQHQMKIIHKVTAKIIYPCTTLYIQCDEKYNKTEDILKR